MIAQIVIALSIFTLAKAGQEAPPPKAHTYNVPTVAKVAYPGPSQVKSVETYSAPSIEKTTTITRTITAPLNAPAERHIAYAPPSGPIVAPQGLAYGLAGGHGHPHGFAGGYGGQFFAAPVPQFVGYAGAPIAHHHHHAPIAHHAGYAAPIAHHHGGFVAPIAHHGGYAAPIQAYAQPGLALAAPVLGHKHGHGYAAAPGGLAIATAYNAPPLGYNLGGPHAHAHVAATPHHHHHQPAPAGYLVKG